MKVEIKYLILILILTFGVSPVYAQTTIEGRVIDQQNAPIPGANVYLEGTYDGNSSDANGNFSFSTRKEGLAILKITYIGFTEFRKEILLDGNSIQIDIVLAEAISRMKGVVITAGTFEGGNENKSEILRPLDIVTTAGATADISGALNTLPGTQTVGEEGRLFVRGGDGYETTTFIDGMAVLDSYDQTAPNIPTRSRFSPFMFSGTSFSTGGYSAEYGQGLSSALILNTKEVPSETRSDFSFITVGLEAAHTQAWKESSLIGKIGYFNLDPYYKMIKQDFDWINPPTSFDGNLAFRTKVGKNGTFKSYGKYNQSNMTFNYDPFELSTGLVRTRMQNTYGHGNVSYKDILSEKWMLKTGLSYTLSTDEIKLDNDLVEERNEGLHFKAVAGYEHNDRLFLNIGGEVISRSHFQDFNDFETGFQNRFDFSENIISTFIEANYYFSNALVARVGERIEYNTLSKKISVDPRISLALKTGEESQLSMAYGNFRQSAPKTMLRVSSGLGSEKATHFIVNYQIMSNNRTFRIEGYWKEYQDLVTFDPAFPYLPDSYSNAGDGYARGFDIFFRDGKSLRNIDYWLSYSYLDTEREYRDYPYRASPTFTSEHNFSAVYKHFITSIRTQIGFTYSFGSGRPYNDPNKELFNGEQTPNYHDLSSNFSFLAKSNIIVYASITNILNRENIFGYEYRAEPDNQGVYEGRAITLPAPRFLLLGVFITLTKSNTTNQLPNL